MVYSQPRPARPPLLCGSCRECCRGPRELEITEPAFLFETYGRDGKTYLATRENGDCVYLVKGGCSIYGWRPQACRDYDCRDFATHPGMPIRIRLQAVRRMPVRTANPCNPCRAKKRKKKKPKPNPSVQRR